MSTIAVGATTIAALEVFHEHIGGANADDASEEPTLAETNFVDCAPQ